MFLSKVTIIVDLLKVRGLTDWICKVGGCWICKGQKPLLYIFFCLIPQLFQSFCPDMTGLEADSLFSCSAALFPVPKPEMLVQQHLLSPFSRLHVSRGCQTMKRI